MIVLRGGTVIDGTGKPGFRADVGVVDGRVAKLGAGLTGDRVIDCAGKVVCPGFIDMHSHSDLVLFRDPGLPPKMRQGITTELLGQDGISVAPVKPQDMPDVRKRLAGLLTNPETPRWSTMAEYLDAIRKSGCASNTAMLVPHGAVRQWVMGMASREPTVAELADMRRVLAQALDEGALGMSTGLIYPPCVYATSGELVELGRELAARDKPLVAHIRNEGDYAIEAVRELMSVGRESGCRVHISHFKICGRENWPRIGEMLDAVADGATADVYPYTAGSTMLGAILPPWMHEGGANATVKRLRTDRKRAMGEILSPKPARWDNFWRYAGPEGIVIADCPRPEYVGRTLAQCSRDPLTFAFDLLEETRLGVAMISFTMQEKDVETILRLKYSMICTDGLLGGRPHPRVYGAFARVLAWARDKKLFSIEEAVRKMTSLPADTLRIPRGRIQEGEVADLVVFDTATVRDTATFEEPRQHPVGIEHVMTGHTPGEVITR